MVKFTDADRARITAAIHSAEKDTSGEFVAVVARASDHYLGFSLLWATAIALLLPGVLLFFPHAPRAAVLYQIQLGVFIALMLLFSFVPALHMALVPKRVRRDHASRMAHLQFHLQGVHHTREHSGVLFFVSLAERYVEIVADKGIHQKLGEAHWQTVVGSFLQHVQQGDVTGGFVAAIEACGAAMAEHYPAKPGDPDELSDGLIEI
jgi:putative membrane protein